MSMKVKPNQEYIVWYKSFAKPYHYADTLLVDPYEQPFEIDMLVTI